MPEPVSKLLKGLTKDHIQMFALMCAGVLWFARIEPRLQAAETAHTALISDVKRIADTFEGMRKEVAEIRTEVKVHGVLIASMESLKSDIKELRNDLGNTNNRITNWKDP